MVAELLERGGFKTPPAQLNPNALYWMASPAIVHTMARAARAIEIMPSGGLRINNPTVAASIMDEIYSGRVPLREGFNIAPVDRGVAARIRSDIRSIGSLPIQLYQRLLDGESSYDLRGFANLVYRQLHRRG
ncbi:MAG: hypothetical protein AABZ57_02705, partial [Candidatus Margulisiibacteriota bacterium]